MNNLYYVKIWGFAVFIITIIYFILLNIIKNDNIYTDNTNEINRMYIKSITPAYPPPLVNFNDGTNIFKKTISVDNF